MDVLVCFWFVNVEVKKLNEYMLIDNGTAHVRLLHRSVEGGSFCGI